MRKKFVLAIAIFTLSSQSFAQPDNGSFTTAERLVDTCRNPQPPFDMLCLQYVLGVYDTVSLMRMMGLLNPSQVAYCPPESLRPTDLVDKVRLHLILNPPKPKSTTSAAVVVISALSRAYPCAK